MEWRDRAIVLGARRHGETSVILELMTLDHGRHLGMVRGGRSRSMQPVLQPGNEVQAVWRARIEEQLGAFAIEPLRSNISSALQSARSLNGVNLLCALLRLFPERDPHPAIFETSLLVLEHLGDRSVEGPLIARFELAVLQELGFGLDLTRCAATGTTTDLAYVSPKTGRAVGRGPGEAWKERLFPLPGFLAADPSIAHPTPDELAAAFAITGHFLMRDILQPRGLILDARQAYLTALGTEGEISDGPRKPVA